MQEPASHARRRATFVSRGTVLLCSVWVLAGAGCREVSLDEATDALGEQAHAAGAEVAEKTAAGLAATAKQAQDWVAKEQASGELTREAMAALRSAGDGFGGLVSQGAQLAPAAMEIGKVLYEAVDRDVSIDPIYQPVDDVGARAELDASIHDMPRVETIEGLEVGFKDVSSLDAARSASESAYLVVWRRESHLVGFVYRSKSAVDLERLIAEAPRLIRLVNGATGEDASGEAEAP